MSAPTKQKATLLARSGWLQKLSDAQKRESRSGMFTSEAMLKLKTC